MRLALISGATAGIGEATARLFAAEGIDLIICGRRSERLQALKEELEGQVRVHTLTFDLRDRDAIFSAIESLPEDFRTIDILINNAGNAHGLDPIDTGDVVDWENMIDINIKGLLFLSRAIIPGMVERKSGHVINIGSIAGREVYPNGNVYCASKYAVEALTQGMRLDLFEHGIKVSSISPGAVETEFSLVRFKGDKERAAAVYEGYDPLTAHDVAETILFAVTRPSHVNIADMMVMPTAQAGMGKIKK